MKKLLILTVFFFVIFGCATPKQPKMEWIGLQNQTETQFYQDKYECEVHVAGVMGPPPNPNPSVNIPSTIIGNRPLYLHEVYRPPDPGLVALAADAMRRNNMITSCLEAKGYRLREVGAGRQDILPPKLRVGFGFWLSGLNNDFTIVSILPGGPAARAGLKEGDRIWKIDDIELLGLTFLEISQRFLTAPVGKNRIFTVLRDGDEKKVELIAE